MKLKWPLMENTISWSDRFQLIKFLATADKFTNGPMIKEFEKQWALWVGSKHALMVNSGSTANLLIVSTIKEFYQLRNGDKVLVPACTWVTNISPVIQCGLEPVFCDVNLSNFSFNVEHMQQIAKQHPDIKVIFVSHLLGFSAENEIYKKIFPNALIIDDVCESHGCLDAQGNKQGHDSLGASFSFYFGHHMTTIEGGMINTNNTKLYELMRLKRSHGMARESADFKKYADAFPEINPQFLFVTDGYNFRSTEINAVLGLNQLKRLDKMIFQRRANFALFTDIINANQDKFYPISCQSGASNFAFPFICKTKEICHQLKTLFDQAGIEHRPVIGGNLLRQPFLKNYVFGTTIANSNADIINFNGLYIGNNHFVTRHDMLWLERILQRL